MTLKSVNLKLLPVLQALLKHQSVTGASRALGLSPSAVSESLARLREVLNDSLLVRVGARMQLTSRATELIAPLEELCATIDQFFQRGQFDPLATKRSFVIATSDALAYKFAPEMLRVVRRHAPGIRIHFIDIDKDLTKRMAERQIDFAFLPEFALEDLAPAPLRFRRLDIRSRAILMCRTHPLAKKEHLSKADVLAYQHISFSPDAVMLGAHRKPKLPTGELLDVAVRVPFMTLVPQMLIDTDLLAIVGQRIAEDSVLHLPLAFKPLEFDAGFTPRGMVWSPVYDGDLAHKWMRTYVADEVARAMQREWKPALVTKDGHGIKASTGAKRGSITRS